MAKGIKGSGPSKEEKPIRTGFNILPATMEKIRYIAFMEKSDLTKLVAEGLGLVINRFEKKNGPIPVK